MANYENEGQGSGFVMGLLTGTVLGAGLGLLFAPRAGSELRGQIGESAANLSRTAQDQYRRATETASGIVDRGRDLYDRARESVSRGADEARRFASEAQEDIGRSMGGTTYPPTGTSQS